MQYTVSINQLSITKHFPAIDLKDAAIIDFLKHFFQTKEAARHRIVEGGNDYYWITYAKLIDEMPLLRIENERAMKRRLDGLVEAGVLVRHPQCRELNKSYFAFTEKSELIWSTYTTKSTEVVETYAPESTKGYAPKSTKPYAPESTDNHNTSIIIPKQSSLPPSNDGKQTSFEERSENFRNKIRENKGEYTDAMLYEFFNYWTEKNENGKKMRFELEKVFDVKKRLATWHKRATERVFKPKEQQPEKPQVYVAPKNEHFARHGFSQIDSLAAKAAQKMKV